MIGGGATVATNMFLKEGDSWKMVHHHASPTSALPSENDDEEPVLQ
jgi:ketosteroid isomerase-like protein